MNTMNPSSTSRPYFLWDYDLTETDVRRLLAGENKTDKIWILSRLLESARLEDVWQYTTLSQVRALFPELKLKPIIRRAWEYALHVWQ